MKQFAMAMLAGMMVAGSLRCAAEAECGRVTVEASVAVAGGDLTLANLLAQGSCGEWMRAAAGVSLGVAPQPGSPRVIEGEKVRSLLDGLVKSSVNRERTLGKNLGKNIEMQVPGRIVVRRAGVPKTCAEIGRFVASAAPEKEMANAPSEWKDELNCASARGILETVPLKLNKTEWNPRLRRWEFSLGCARPEDCVPFLVWTRADARHAPGTHQEKTRAAGTAAAQTGTEGPASARSAATSLITNAGSEERLIKSGQTAVLIWDEGGIRIVLPVTCLDGGGVGQFVRVQFKNAPRILRAEVLGDGTLRANL